MSVGLGRLLVAIEHNLYGCRVTWHWPSPGHSLSLALSQSDCEMSCCCFADSQSWGLVQDARRRDHEASDIAMVPSRTMFSKEVC